MESKLQKRLHDSYPSFFRQRTLPMSETCMCWGIECGDGWFQIIDEAIGSILRVAPKAEACQIKEKFGGLRIYLDHSNEAAEAIVDKAEAQSYKTCEDCGKAGSPNKSGWIRTNCKGCRKNGKKE